MIIDQSYSATLGTPGDGVALSVSSTMIQNELSLRLPIFIEREVCWYNEPNPGQQHCYASRGELWKQLVLRYVIVICATVSCLKKEFVYRQLGLEQAERHWRSCRPR